MNPMTAADNILHALEGSYAYIDMLKLFYITYGSIPCVEKVSAVNNEVMTTWIEANLNMRAKYYSNDEFRPFGDQVEKTVLYLLHRKVAIKVEGDSFTFYFAPEEESYALSMAKKASETLREKPGPEISLVVVSQNQLDTTTIRFRKPELDLDTHYNDDIIPLHQKLLNLISKRDRSGLVLFHGTPGTGKSTYIKYLITHTNKQVIFLTPELAGSMGSPDIARFLIRHSNCIFVIEDAEQLIVSRDLDQHSSISTMLNLTDGILGESLGIQIIATFNTDLVHVDKALLRKGRMLARYEFKPLVREKAASLMAGLGHDDITVRGPMTLADIYNYDGTETESIPVHREYIGFRKG